MKNVIIYCSDNKNYHSSLEDLEVVVVHLFVQPFAPLFITSGFFFRSVLHKPFVEVVYFSYVIGVWLEVFRLVVSVVYHGHFMDLGIYEVEYSTYQHYKFLKLKLFFWKLVVSELVIYMG